MKTTSFKVTQAAIEKCERNTNRKHPGWSEQCYKLLMRYIKHKRKPWMCEDFRAWCEGKILMPDSLRAFGAIMHRASHRGLIKKIQIKSVKTPSSHMANAAVWTKK